MKKRRQRCSASARPSTSAMTSVYNYNRWQPSQSLTITEGSIEFVFATLTFQLADLASTDLTNYRALFEFYRLNSVAVRFRLPSNPDAYAKLNVVTGPAVSYFYPEIYLCTRRNCPLELFMGNGSRTYLTHRRQFRFLATTI